MFPYITAGIFALGVGLILRGLHKMSQQVDELRAEVARNTTVDQSAIVLLNGLADRLREIAEDPAAIRALSEELKGSSTALADAVTANTPTT